MHVPDLINSGFEGFGGVAVWMNVLQLYRDKGYAGVHLGPTIFFTTFSLWNLWYYPHLNQLMSFVGAAFLGSGNLATLLLMLYYGRKK